VVPRWLQVPPAEVGGRAPPSGTGHQWGDARTAVLAAAACCMTLDPMVHCCGSPNGVDAPVVPVQTNNAAPHLIVIWALARSQPTFLGVRSTANCYQSCGAD
jgi:hypothetical protein